MRETNDWLLVEWVAGPDPVLVLFDESRPMDAGFLSAALQHEGPVRFYRVNVDENPSVMETYHLKKHPTVLLFVGGKEVGRRTGLLDGRSILELLTRKTK